MKISRHAFIASVCIALSLASNRPAHARLGLSDGASAPAQTNPQASIHVPGTEQDIHKVPGPDGFAQQDCGKLHHSITTRTWGNDTLCPGVVELVEVNCADGTLGLVPVVRYDTKREFTDTTQNVYEECVTYEPAVTGSVVVSSYSEVRQGWEFRCGDSCPIDKFSIDYIADTPPVIVRTTVTESNCPGADDGSGGKVVATESILLEVYKIRQTFYCELGGAVAHIEDLPGVEYREIGRSTSFDYSQCN